jgi:hypothetical protein
MVANVAIAIQSQMVLESKPDQLQRIFDKCEKIAYELYKVQWKSYCVHFVLDEENQTVRAYTKSDDYYNGKKPIFTIEKIPRIA